MNDQRKIDPDYIEPTMALPEGKTCADCFYVKRCVRISCTVPDRKMCDFYPVKFIAAFLDPTP